MGTGFSNVEPAFIGRKSQTIGPSEIPDYRLEISSLGIEAIERRRLFRLLSPAFVVVEESVKRIAKPDRSIPFDDDVIRGVQSFAGGCVDEGAEASVVLQSGDTTAAVVALNQTSLWITCLPVGVVRGLHEHAESFAFAPAQRLVVGDVVEEKTVVVPKPEGPLQPAKSVGQPLQFGIEQHQLVESGIKAFSARRRLSHG